MQIEMNAEEAQLICMVRAMDECCEVMAMHRVEHDEFLRQRVRELREESQLEKLSGEINAEQSGDSVLMVHSSS